MSTIIAIDPGASGGIVASHYPHKPGNITAFKMPDTDTDIISMLDRLHNPEGTIVVIERVGGYVPGNSGPAAVTFARGIGFLEGALMAMKYQFDPPLGVLPRKWQESIEGKPIKPVTKGMPIETKKRLLAEYKRDLKNSIKEYVQRLNPDIKVTLATADALGILHWYLKQKGHRV